MTWANEYRQGRAEQVEQQRIANLIAVSECFAASTDARNWAIAEALRSLGFAPCSSDPSSTHANGARMPDAIRKRAEEVAAKVYPEPYHRHMKNAYADAFERGYREAQDHTDGRSER